MLAVQPQQFDFPRDEMSLDSAPTLQLKQTQTNLKQQVKKSMFSPYKILLALAVVFMLVMVSFKIYNQFIVQPQQSQITSAHGKIIQNAGDSSKDKASNSGSSSSKSSKNNDRPNQASQPASKGPISSNTNLNGGSFDNSSNDGNDDQDENDGQKRKKSIDKNKSSDTRSSKYGSSTDDDSQSVESEEQNEGLNDGLIWPTDTKEGPQPLIGSARP